MSSNINSQSTNQSSNNQQREKLSKHIQRKVLMEEKKKKKEEEKLVAKPKKERKPRKKKDESNPTIKNKKEADLICKLATEVYQELGAGHTESIYHNAMKIQIQDKGLKFESERDIPVLFKGRYVGTVRADVIIDNKIVLEFKISGNLEDAMLQCRQYMKLHSIPIGFVVLFPKHEGEHVKITEC